MQMSLMDYLNDNFNDLTKENKLAIFRQVAQAVDYCHGQGIMHRDIKMENILVNVDQNGQVTDLKLADFGFACKDQVLTSQDHFCGSLPYMSPEQLQENGTYDKSVDVWSMGHILFSLLNGSQLYDESR